MDHAGGAAPPEHAGETFNFETANVLLLEQGGHGLDILVQIFCGFGARNCYKCLTVDDAKTIARRCPLDLVVMDPALHKEDGLDFVRWLRRSGGDPNRTIPVLALSAIGAKSAVAAARDAGVSAYILKPVIPAVLLSRLVRVVREPRAFVVAEGYAGPDRRFRSDGPPEGCAPRRASDARAQLCQPRVAHDDASLAVSP